MIIDVSHASDETIYDVLNICTKPIMASHSNSRSLCNIKRNLPDKLIIEIGEKSGYIGINFYPGFLNKKIYNQIMKNYKKYKEEYLKEIQENNYNSKNMIDLEKKFSLKLIENNDNLNLNKIAP